MKQVVAIGAGVAGKSLAVALSHYPNLQTTIFDAALGQQEDLRIASNVPISPASVHVAPHVQFVHGKVKGIDVAQKQVMTQTKTVPYDFAVVATGAEFRVSDDEQFEHGAPLYSPWRMHGRAQIRQAVHSALALAAQGLAPCATVCVIGGGRVGVATAGHVYDFWKSTEFAHTKLEIILVEQQSRLVPALPAEAARVAESALHSLGIQVVCNTPITTVSKSGHVGTVSGTVVHADVCIWAGTHVPVGIPLFGQNKAKALPYTGEVNTQLQVRPYETVFALGDAARVPVVHRGPTAAEIFSEAQYLSTVIASLAQNRVPPTRQVRPTAENIYVGAGWEISVDGGRVLKRKQK